VSQSVALPAPRIVAAFDTTTTGDLRSFSRGSSIFLCVRKAVVMFMYKESAPLPEPRTRFIALALVQLIAAFSTDGQTLLSPPVACALSGQAGEPPPFDPNEIEFVSKPKPASLGDQRLDLAIGFVARIVSLRPLIVEILDASGNQSADFHYCQMVRIMSVDARLRRVLGQLRFNDVVKGEFMFSEGGLEKLVVTNLKKVEGAPAYFHERDKAACDNRTGTLMVYQTPSGGRLVLYNDLTISYRDQKGKFFERQKLESESLSRLMQSFGDVNFNAFPSRKWTDELATDSAITLVCGRYQKVMFDGREAVLARVLRSLNDVREIALANTYYVLSYKERRELAFLEWPLPNLSPDRVQSLRQYAAFDEQQAKTVNRPIDSRFLAFQQRLPQDFLDKLPVFPSYSRQSNTEVYVKSDSRIFRLFRDGGVAPPRAGTLYEIRVEEVIPPENAFAKTATPGVEPPCASLASSGGLFWPSGTGVDLQRIPPTGQPISVEEYAARQPLYGRLLKSCSGAGFDFIEGTYLYRNVQLTRRERESR